MKVKELIELNQLISDIVIEVRQDGNALLDALEIGPKVGIKPPYPTMVPKSEKYIGNFCIETKREATYIPKSINARQDGKDYWQLKVNRIPAKWLDLEVYSFNVWSSFYGHSNEGQRINIVALPSGETLTVPEPTKSTDTELEGQMNITDFI